MAQDVSRWVYLPAPEVTRQATFKIHEGNLAVKPLPLSSSQWLLFGEPRAQLISSTPVTSERLMVVRRQVWDQLAPQVIAPPAQAQPEIISQTKIVFS
ncbi:hypothetical protein [Lactiplantibacillus herbarum]|uniref:hypothetical protein n=1 Tax=Lactiplantibacillus herbarum TaxID=1670446 RepID=UPI00064FDEDD|nr:hypothetical protein [Lactiplantibacillus herbarum]